MSMDLSETNNPTEEELEEAYRIVMEKNPEVLYRVLKAFNYEQGDPEVVAKMSRVYAFYLFHLYIASEKSAPEDTDALIADLGHMLEEFRTPIEEAVLIVEQADYQSYIEEHNLQWALDLIHEITEGDVDLEIDRGFICDIHRSGGTIPDDPELLGILYSLYLSVTISL